METVISIHDKFFQETFTRADIAKSFLSEYLPEQILKRVNLNALTIAKDSFVDEEFREHASDILYTVPFGDA